MKRARFHLPLTLIAALAVLLIAFVAAGSLWVLRSMQNRQARSTATLTVLEAGRLIATELAAQPTVKNAPGEEEGWGELSRLVRSVHTIENGLQYVSVIHDGVTVFHEQTGKLDGPLLADVPAPDRMNPGAVRLGRKRLGVGPEALPVVTFTVPFKTVEGAPGVVEIALRKDTVEREETAAAGAIVSMFKLSLATVVVSFAICTVLVVWLMRREVRRERQRREEEHLAFAGVMANGIVHDFRNPMSSLRLDVQMLEREAGKGEACRSDRVVSLAGRVRNTLDRMDKVFREFFYLSTPSSDEREAVDLAACVRDCLDMLSPRFEQAQLGVETELPAAGPTVLARPVSLRRALINVVLNAEQFSPAGGKVRVEVSTSEDSAVVDVMDRGPGVPRAERKRIFDMFVSSRPGGTGIGLFLTRTALERCGGGIQVKDRAGGGACFRIRLPLAQGHPEGVPNGVNGQGSLVS